MVEGLDAILDVPHIDAILVGPADLALSCGAQPGDPEHGRLCASVLERCRARGVPAGTFVTGERTAHSLAAEGWQMIGLGLDSQFLLAGVHQALAAAKG